uniref:Ribonuclease III n=1 Tax=Schistocephalus solidus TaxID=70667 RepID=A0A183SQT5_SCHSO
LSTKGGDSSISTRCELESPVVNSNEFCTYNQIAGTAKPNIYPPIQLHNGIGFSSGFQGVIPPPNFPSPLLYQTSHPSYAYAGVPVVAPGQTLFGQVQNLPVPFAVPPPPLPPLLNAPPPPLPIFNIPPPLPSPTPIASASLRQASRSDGSGRISQRAPRSSPPKLSGRGQSKAVPAREHILFANISCSPADSFFTPGSKGGCKFATKDQRLLEDNFEERVLRRSSRALAACNYTWTPLKRPEITDTEPDARVTSFSKHSRKRAASRKNPEKMNRMALTEKNADNQSLLAEDTSEYAEKSPKNSDYVDSPDIEAFSPDDLMELITNNVSEDRSRSSMPSLLPDAAERGLRQQLEVAHKLAHPLRLHPDIWHNEEGEHNNGPACSCKPKYRIGPLHKQYEGEEAVPLCDPESNNHDRLFHYRVMVNPTTNFFNLKPTTIHHDGHDYLFDGFSIFLHSPLEQLPPCQLLRFNLLYDFVAVEEEFPHNFTVRSLDMLTDYIFRDLLELLDLNWRPAGVTSGCPVVHLLPRFVRIVQTTSSGTTAELLSVNVILEHWMRQTELPVIDALELAAIQKMSDAEWSDYIHDLRGTLAWYPGKKPPALRLDQLDRRSVSLQPSSDVLVFPFIVHMTYTPMKLSLSREPKYKSVLKNFMKLQYLLMNKPRITAADRANLTQLANELDMMEHSGVHRREITVELSCEGFYRTGIRPDVTQFALNMASFIAHVRCHKSLETLEQRLGYKFKDKSLLHQALTHPSYRRTNFGTNQDHFQNTLVSCGPRTIEYGDKLQLYKAWRKKGLSKMIQVMSFLPKQHEERSKIYGNERLEFLGDAVIEIIASVHLFFMFPDLPEGSLDAYRQALVQNQHLAELALRLGLHKFLLYTHSVDFCYDSTYVYARSDAFEAVMAAIALDAGLDTVDRIFGAVLFGNCPRIHQVWVRLPPHPLQAQFPDGDRQWATSVPMLKVSHLAILPQLLFLSPHSTGAAIIPQIFSLSYFQLTLFFPKCVATLSRLKDPFFHRSIFAVFDAGSRFRRHYQCMSDVDSTTSLPYLSLSAAVLGTQTFFSFPMVASRDQFLFCHSQKLTRLEDQLGIKFRHIRVLARALTVRKTGFNLFTLGDNQRLEFLGDSLLKYVSTDYLFRHFPRHHEGHLSLLKNSLVNKYTQAAVCTELGLDNFIIRREENSISSQPPDQQEQPPTMVEMQSASTPVLPAGSNAQKQNVKYKADLLEAFIGALYVDKDMTWVERFCQVCFWPRLVEFILKQEWNDAKSKLQQCLLLFVFFRFVPYQVLDHSGPSNQRIYRVGVFFRGVRLAVGTGRSVQCAQMEAAKVALETHQETFKQLDFQRSVIVKRYRQPYIDKMLNQLETWDEELVDRFVDNPADGLEDNPKPSSLSSGSHTSPVDFQRHKGHDFKRRRLASPPNTEVSFTTDGPRSCADKVGTENEPQSSDFDMDLEGDSQDDEEKDSADDGSPAVVTASSKSTPVLLSGTVADFFIGHSSLRGND